jgi:hypothetical protein
MNAYQTIAIFAETQNASLVIDSLHLHAFQLEGYERTCFLKDMYTVANELLNEMDGYSMDLGNMINWIAEYANRP